MNDDANKAKLYVWMDAYEAEGEWYGTDYVPTHRLMYTYGYVLAQTNDYVALASTYDPELEQYACVINIPLGMVVSVQEVSPETFPPKNATRHPIQHPTTGATPQKGTHQPYGTPPVDLPTNPWKQEPAQP